MASKSYGYGKRPLWQWILIYVVVGAVIYGVVYYFFFYKKGVSYNTPMPATSTNQNRLPTY